MQHSIATVEPFNHDWFTQYQNSSFFGQNSFKLDYGVLVTKQRLSLLRQFGA